MPNGFSNLIGIPCIAVLRPITGNRAILNKQALSYVVELFQCASTIQKKRVSLWIAH